MTVFIGLVEYTTYQGKPSAPQVERVRNHVLSLYRRCGWQPSFSLGRPPQRDRVLPKAPNRLCTAFDADGLPLLKFVRGDGGDDPVRPKRSRLWLHLLSLPRD